MGTSQDEMSRDKGEAGRPGRRARPTLLDVARHAGLSRSTVSLVLQESPLVARETRERVQASMAAVGYVYNRGAANLRASKTRTVGVIVPDITNPAFAQLALGVEEELDRAGWAAFLVNSRESLDKQQRFLTRMREYNVDGVIVCPAVETPPDVLERLRQWAMPCVQALRHVEDVEGDYTGADYEGGIEAAVEHLVGLGHRRLALVGGDRDHSASRARRTAFTAVMGRHGLAPDLVLRTPITRKAGAEVVDRILGMPDRPTGIVCYSDVLALGAILALTDRGLRAGRDLAVTGFDDVPEAAYARPPLTTVASYPFRVGEEAARLLLRRLADPEGVPERIIVPTRLVVRASCGALARAVPAA